MTVIVYKFKCKECKHQTDNDNSNDTACPECGGELMKQDMKLETKELRDVEIMEMGDWKGMPWF